MNLYDPFRISARLAPALRVGDTWNGEHIVPGRSWISLVKTEPGDERRTRYTFVIDGLAGSPQHHIDHSVQSGNGAWSHAEAFHTFVNFLLAAVESREYEERHNLRYGEGENTDLFPRHVVEWAVDHKASLETLLSEMSDGDGNPREELIQA